MYICKQCVVYLCYIDFIVARSQKLTDKRVEPTQNVKKYSYCYESVSSNEPKFNFI